METASIIPQIHTKSRPFTGRTSRPNQPAAKRTVRDGRNGFLNYSFQPLQGFYVGDWKMAEAEFFLSAGNICRFYSIEEPKIAGLKFPENVQASYERLEDILSKKGVELKIMQDETHDACLATTKQFDTGYRLFYLPIRPVCNLSLSGETLPLSKVMTGIYQYLYQCIGVDYYREPCYLNYLYETIENWIDEDYEREDEDARKYQHNEIDNLKNLGDRFLLILKQPFKIDLLISFLSEYRDSPCWSFEIDTMVQEFLKLITDFPSRTINDSIPYDYFRTGENDLITLEHYLSFYWSAKDGFTEMLDDMINNELQEMGFQEEPVAIQWFDKLPVKEHHDLEFETRLFALIDTTINLMNDYDFEKH